MHWGADNMVGARDIGYSPNRKERVKLCVEQPRCLTEEHRSDDEADGHDPFNFLKK